MGSDCTQKINPRFVLSIRDCYQNIWSPSPERQHLRCDMMCIALGMAVIGAQLSRGRPLAATTRDWVSQRAKHAIACRRSRLPTRLMRRTQLISTAIQRSHNSLLWLLWAKRRALSPYSGEANTKTWSLTVSQYVFHNQKTVFVNFKATFSSVKEIVLYFRNIFHKRLEALNSTPSQTELSLIWFQCWHWRICDISRVTTYGLSEGNSRHNEE